MSGKDEFYQIALDIDRGDGNKLADLIIERNNLEWEVKRLKEMITQLTIERDRG